MGTDGISSVATIGIADYRRPSERDMPGERLLPGHRPAERRVIGPLSVGPVEILQEATVTLDARGAVDQIRAQAPLRVPATVDGTWIAVRLRGRVELRDTGWRAWGVLLTDLRWSGGELHAGDEIDVVDGVLAGAVLHTTGRLGEQTLPAGAILDFWSGP